MNKQDQTTGNPWEEVEPISIYSRADALADGVLVDLTEFAREAGFKYPLAVTQGVWGVLNPSDELKAEGQDLTGRAWDMLAILRHDIRHASRPDEVYFAPLFIMKPEKPPESVALLAKCSPGDAGEATITVMLREED